MIFVIFTKSEFQTFDPNFEFGAVNEQTIELLQTLFVCASTEQLFQTFKKSHRLKSLSVLCRMCPNTNADL